MPSEDRPTSPAVEPDAIIRFVEGRKEYAPGDRLQACISVLNCADLDCRSSEVSVVWHTVGKGDEDLYVHSFKRLPGDTATLATPYELDVPLPSSPLSYDGLSVKVCWCIRLRLYLSGYRSYTLEAPFRLGKVSMPQAPAKA